MRVRLPVPNDTNTRILRYGVYPYPSQISAARRAVEPSLGIREFLGAEEFWCPRKFDADVGFHPMVPGRGGDYSDKYMNLNVNLPAIVALAAGILILVRPPLLNLIVAIYLIVIGVLGLLGRA